MPQQNMFSAFCTRMFKCSSSAPKVKNLQFQHISFDSEVSEVTKTVENKDKQDVVDDSTNEERHNESLKRTNKKDKIEVKNISEKEELPKHKSSKEKNAKIQIEDKPDKIPATKPLENNEISKVQEKSEKRNKKNSKTMKMKDLKNIEENQKIKEKQEKKTKEKANKSKDKHKSVLTLSQRLSNLDLESSVDEKSLEEYLGEQRSSEQSEKSDEETEVSCVIDFYDKGHFNKILAKKMECFLTKKKRKRII